MTLTLTIIKCLYPFLALLAFFCLYRKRYRWMETFCYAMVVKRNARKLFGVALFSLLLFFSWCCYETRPDIWAMLTNLLILPLLSSRVADRVLRTLNDRLLAWVLTLLVAVVCYAVPCLYGIGVSLFLMAIASCFYPSREVLDGYDGMVWMSSETIGEFRQRMRSCILAHYYKSATCKWHPKVFTHCFNNLKKHLK